MKNLILNSVTLALMLVLFVSCSSDNESNPSSSTEVVKSYTHSTAELELLDQVNNYRVSIGLNPLNIIDHISYKSAEHNDYMYANHVVTHDGFDKRKSNLQEVLGAYRVGENIAYGYSSASSTVNAWINSPSHKANLEGDYTHFGGAIKIDEEGKKYYTNIFIKK